MSDIDLQAIKHRAQGAAEMASLATPGPWYPRATDDEHFMNARFVGARRGPTRREWHFPDGATHVLESVDGFMHDNKRGLAEGDPDQEPSDAVIAITLLQQPRLAEMAECDQNTRFIAQAREDVPQLAADVFELVTALAVARDLLQMAWNQLGGDLFLLPDGTVHPGAVSTLHELHGYLWPEGKAE